MGLGLETSRSATSLANYFHKLSLPFLSFHNFPKQCHMPLGDVSYLNHISESSLAARIRTCWLGWKRLLLDFPVLIRQPPCLMPYKIKKDEPVMMQSIEKERNHFSKLKGTKWRSGLQFPKGRIGMQKESSLDWSGHTCLLCGWLHLCQETSKHSMEVGVRQDRRL